MELWWRLRGWKRLRLTSADCPSRLRQMAERVKLTDIVFPEPVTPCRRAAAGSPIS